jgi:DNA-binding response OmpR family regulator
MSEKTPTSHAASNVVSLSSRRRGHANAVKKELRGWRHILVAGSDGTTYRIIQEIARQLRAGVTSVNTSEEALDHLESSDYDLSILVNHPPTLDAVHIIKLFGFLSTGSPCKFLVLHDTPDWVLTAKIDDVNNTAHIQTPFNPSALKKVISSLLDQVAG